MFIFGDSHANALKNAAASLGQPVHGGILGAGRDFNVAFYSRTGNDFRFARAETHAVYQDYLRAAGVDTAAQLRMPILCLFGMNLHYLSRQDVWAAYATRPRDPGQFLSGAVVRETTRAMIEGAWLVIEDLDIATLDLQSALRPLLALPDAARFREEDPLTGLLLLLAQFDGRHRVVAEEFGFDTSYPWVITDTANYPAGRAALAIQSTGKAIVAGDFHNPIRDASVRVSLPRQVIESREPFDSPEIDRESMRRCRRSETSRPIWRR